MKPQKTTSRLSILLATMGISLIIGCGGGPKGVYSNTENDELSNSHIEFLSGGKVRLAQSGVSVNGKYKKEGNTVYITIGQEGVEQTLNFSIDKKGCLNSEILGKYCK